MSLDTLIPRLEDPAQPVPASDLVSLSNLDRTGHERFVDVWRRLSVQRRRDVIDRLADLAEDNVEFDFNRVFLTGLLDGDVQVRAESIKALWEYEGDDLAGLLLRLLHDPEAIVRAEAALGLGRFLLRAELDGEDGSPTREIEEALLDVARDERELTEVRGRAIEALGVRSKEWARDLIEDAYGSGDRRLRISAVHAMGRSSDASWLPAIIEEMESDDAEMRFESAAAAGSMGDEDAVAPLAHLASDTDAEVQEAAIAALGQIGGPAARAALNAIADENRDARVLDAVSDALAEAEFVEDPLGFRMRLDRAAAEDDGEGDE